MKWHAQINIADWAADLSASRRRSITTLSILHATQISGCLNVVKHQRKVCCSNNKPDYPRQPEKDSRCLFSGCLPCIAQPLRHAINRLMHHLQHAPVVRFLPQLAQQRHLQAAQRV